MKVDSLIVGDILIDKHVELMVSYHPNVIGEFQEKSVTFGLAGAANVALCCKFHTNTNPLLLGFNTDSTVDNILGSYSVNYQLSYPSLGKTVTNVCITQKGNKIVSYYNGVVPCGEPNEFWKSVDAGHIGKTIENTFIDDEWHNKFSRPVLCLVNEDKGCLTTDAIKFLTYKARSTYDTVKFPFIVAPGAITELQVFGSQHTIFYLDALQVKRCFDLNRRLAAYTSYEVIKEPFGGSIDDSEALLHAFMRYLLELKTQFRYVVLNLGKAGGLAVGSCTKSGPLREYKTAIYPFAAKETKSERKLYEAVLGLLVGAFVERNVNDFKDMCEAVETTAANVHLAGTLADRV